MAGKKGRSGRKSKYREVEEGKLEKVCANYLLDNFDSFPDTVKQKVSLTISSKAVTQKSEVKTEIKDVTPEESEIIREAIIESRRGLLDSQN